MKITGKGRYNINVMRDTINKYTNIFPILKSLQEYISNFQRKKEVNTCFQSKDQMCI